MRTMPARRVATSTSAKRIYGFIVVALATCPRIRARPSAHGGTAEPRPPDATPPSREGSKVDMSPPHAARRGQSPSGTRPLEHLAIRPEGSQTAYFITRSIEGFIGSEQNW